VKGRREKNVKGEEEEAIDEGKEKGMRRKRKRERERESAIRLITGIRFVVCDEICGQMRCAID